MLSKQVREIWRQFGAPQRMSVVMSLMVATSVLAALLYWGTRPDYRVLYSNLTLTDSAQMREKLEEAKVPVKLGQSGMSISVPASKLYTARLMLAAEGLPGDSSTGFELFEQPKFGLTDFAQKVNYQRALQGELERTVTAMQGIRAARVMLVLPKEHLFSSAEERRSQASVMLTLNGATAIGDAQVQSIVHLLASSVQNLDPTQVTVTDQTGHLLTRSHNADSVMEHGNEQLDVQERTEQRLVEKAQDILDRALGIGNSIVRVSVALDFSDTEQRNEMFDAENRVATSERIVSEDKSAGGERAGGRAGIVANVSVGNPTDMKLDASGNKDKSEEIYTEYVVPSNVSMVRQKGIRIEQLSVAVCLAQKGDAARSEMEIKAISELVSNALGVSTTRSDTIHVSEMPFIAPQQPAKQDWWERLPVTYDTIFKGMGGMVALCVVFGASRKVKRALLASTPSLETPINEARDEERERILKEEPLEMENHLEAVGQLARENPKTVAAWITNAAEWNG
ncbi:flagellar basal-body MS-ring/collar protein FliF [Pontiellaceae bacterium B1224]|nr:flagellar basal-body MS-ring/collar protein FliF [Pontiellaceae bacterium B1224]